MWSDLAHIISNRCSVINICLIYGQHFDKGIFLVVYCSVLTSSSQSLCESEVVFCHSHVPDTAAAYCLSTPRPSGNMLPDLWEKTHWVCHNRCR